MITQTHNNFSQFAYNEISFMLIRLLQAFSEITWAPEACPDAVPPAEWADASEGDKRKPKEKAWLKAHLTMYAHVSAQVLTGDCGADGFVEWILGEYEGGIELV
jgi:hypothetical protein